MTETTFKTWHAAYRVSLDGSPRTPHRAGAPGGPTSPKTPGSLGHSAFAVHHPQLS